MNLSDQIYNDGPTAFSAEDLLEAEEEMRDLETGDLFMHRAALFYTPTENIPERFVGSGPLKLDLPKAIPTFLQYVERPSMMSPRFWVDLIQRHTQKIRWKPYCPATMVITVYDTYPWGTSNMSFGIKALIDAFKVSTSGRSDGKPLYYFGAIQDDDPDSLHSVWKEKHVARPSVAHTTIDIRDGLKLARTSATLRDHRGRGRQS